MIDRLQVDQDMAIRVYNLDSTVAYEFRASNTSVVQTFPTTTVQTSPINTTQSTTQTSNTKTTNTKTTTTKPAESQMKLGDKLS